MEVDKQHSLKVATEIMLTPQYFMYAQSAWHGVSEKETQKLNWAIILNEMGKRIPIIQSVALNERNYGNLQSLKKTEIAEKYGADKVQLWRRSYDTAPQQMAKAKKIRTTK